MLREMIMKVAFDIRYCMIEEKLELSRYIEWTAVSCHTGFRKPDLKAYAAASTRAGIAQRDPSPRTEDEMFLIVDFS